MNTPPEILIEAALFFKGGPVSMEELIAATGLSHDEVQTAVTSLGASLDGRGIRLVTHDGTYALATAPETKEIIEKMRREELEGPLGKAGLETLAIIVFRGPLSRADIEYVRGVNCSTILRSLQIRGLVERVENPSDKRGFLYQGTAELPAYLGLGTMTAMPEYEALKADIEKIFTNRDTEGKSKAPESHEIQ